MFNYIWPILLVVLSNIIYQICTKSVPANMDAFASLTVTYSVGAILSAILFFVFNKGGNLITEFHKLNIFPFLLGISIVGLEVGFIFAYKAGWEISTASIVQSSLLAVALIFVGLILYKEPLNVQKLVGVGVCLVGLVIINLK